MVEPEPGPVRACMNMNTTSEPQSHQPVAVALAEPLLTAEQVADLLAIHDRASTNTRDVSTSRCPRSASAATAGFTEPTSSAGSRICGSTGWSSARCRLVHGTWSGAARERGDAGAIHLPPARMGDERRVTVCGTSPGRRARPDRRSPWRPDRCPTRSAGASYAISDPIRRGSGRAAARPPANGFPSPPRARPPTHTMYFVAMARAGGRAHSGPGPPRLRGERRPR